MKKFIINMLFISVFFGVASKTYAEPIKLPAKVDLAAIDGPSRLSNQSIKDKKILIQFWASWCVGCSKVMEDLLPITAKTEATKYLSVSLDETKEQAVNYFKFQNEKVKTLLPSSWIDPKTNLATALKVKSLPALVLIDSQGNVLENIYGHPSVNQMKKIEDFFK